MRTKVKAQRVEVRPVLRDSHGKLMKGTAPNNPAGRPLGSTGTKLDSLLMSITRVEAKLGKNLLDHYVKQSFKDNSVLISILKKLCPDLKAIEVTAGVSESMPDDAAEAIREKLRERMLQNKVQSPPN